MLSSWITLEIIVLQEGMCQWIAQNLLWSCLLETDWSMDSCWRELKPQVSLAGWLFKEDRESEHQQQFKTQQLQLVSLWGAHPFSIWDTSWETVKFLVNNGKRFFLDRRVHNPLKSCCRDQGLGQDISLTTDLIEQTCHCFKPAKAHEVASQTVAPFLWQVLQRRAMPCLCHPYCFH